MKIEFFFGIFLNKIKICRTLITIPKNRINYRLPHCNNTIPCPTLSNKIDTPKHNDNPCINNPCGPNSQCRVIGTQGACSCLPNYIGRPPNCRPECTINAECASNKACINERCIDPCIGKCGENAVCSVVKHNPVCNCISGYEGDPFTRCTVIVVTCKNLIHSFSPFKYLQHFSHLQNDDRIQFECIPILCM